MNAVAKHVHASTIYTNMVGNPNFPDPTPSMAEFHTAIVQLEGAIVAALDRGRTAIVLKNTAEKKLSEMITRLAAYVNSVCMGDAAMILSSGFHLSKRPEPISKIPAPRYARVKATAFRSQLLIKWEPVSGAIAYVVEEAVAANTIDASWQHVEVTTNASLVLNDRRQDEPHAFRIRAVGRRVQSAYADTYYIQAA